MAKVSDPVWSDILGRVRTQRADLCRGWFSTLEPVELMHGVMEIRAHNDAQRNYLRDQCSEVFTRAAQDSTSRLISLRFTLSANGGPEVSDPAEQRPAFEQETEQLLLNEDYVFEHFVTGPCNRLAHAASVAVSDKPGRAYNPLFLHGSVGLGKSHLLQAICHQVRQHWSGTKILYLSGETFTNHFIEAVEHGAINSLRHRYRHVDVLVIDDIQSLAARDRSQEEFFHTFNTLYQSQRQIILSADSPPKDIPSLEDRLVSRFNWGLVARVDAPCFETRMAIVRKKAKLQCIELPEEAVRLIAQHVDSNIRELEGAITRVDAISQQHGGIVDEEVMREALGEGFAAPAREMPIQQIVEGVTGHFPVRLPDLQSKKRSKSIAFPRQICMYLARELTTMSLEEVGGFFGGRDHTTVIHAHRTITAQRSKNPQLDQIIRDLIQGLTREVK